MNNNSFNLSVTEESNSTSSSNCAPNYDMKMKSSRKRASDAPSSSAAAASVSNADAARPRNRKTKPEIDPSKLAPAPYFSYTDHSRDNDDDPLTPLTPPYRIANFLIKLFCILSRDDLRHIIKWLPHGRSWKIVDPVEFELSVIPVYFGHSSMSSFLRQVNGWGFKRMTKGRNKNSYYNEYFLRGLPHLCKKAPHPGDIVSLNTDSKYEPDFFSISEERPVPERNNPLDPCGASIAIIERCIQEHGPKGRVPLPRSQPGDEDIETTKPHLSASSGQFNSDSLSNGSYGCSASKRVKLTHNMMRSKNNSNLYTVTPFRQSFSGSSHSSLMNNVAFEPSQSSLFGFQQRFSANSRSSSLSFHENSRRSSPAEGASDNNTSPISPPRSSLAVQQLMRLQMIREHNEKKERELLVMRRQQQQLQQKLIIDRILRLATRSDGAVPDQHTLQGMVQMAILEGAKMGYSMHNTSKRVMRENEN